MTKHLTRLMEINWVLGGTYGNDGALAMGWSYDSDTYLYMAPKGQYGTNPWISENSAARVVYDPTEGYTRCVEPMETQP